MKHAKEISLMLLGLALAGALLQAVVFGGQPYAQQVQQHPAYYLVGQGATAQAMAIATQAATQPLLERVAALEAERDELKARLAKLEAAVGTAPAQPKPSEPTPGQPPAQNGEWKPAEVVERNCLKCHSGANAKAGVDYASQEGYRRWIAAGVLEASRNRMPPEKPLSDADVEAMTQAYEASKPFH